MIGVSRYCYITQITVITASLVALGMVMVSSSSMAFSDYSYGSMFYHTIAHAVRIIVGLVLALLIYIMGIKWLRKFSLTLLLIGLVLSLMIFVPAVSVDVNGAARWLRLGPLVFQPYDLFKLGYILFFSYVLERYQEKGDGQRLVVSYVILGTASIILILQPDFGSLLLLVSVAMLTIFVVSGITKHYFYVVMIIIVLGAWMILSEPYRMQRVVMFFDPWSDRYGSGFQLIQALVAEGSGGIYGVGLGQSIQKMLYLPEAHTDFTISIFAEEIGVIGVLATLFLSVYLYILLMGLSRKLRQQHQYFECNVVFLVANFFFLQFLFNLSVNYGMLPTKGITLPFMGYGGTSIVSHIAMIGMALAAGRRSASPRNMQTNYVPVRRPNVILVS